MWPKKEKKEKERKGEKGENLKKKKKKKKNLTAAAQVAAEAGSIPGRHRRLKDLALPQWQLGFSPWPEKGHRPQGQPFKNKKEKQ